MVARLQFNAVDLSSASTTSGGHLWTFSWTSVIPGPIAAAAQMLFNAVTAYSSASAQGGGHPDLVTRTFVIFSPIAAAAPMLFLFCICLSHRT
jgi:hypothetical protein